MARIGFDLDGVLFPYTERLRQYILDNSEYTEERLTPIIDWHFYEAWGFDSGWYQHWNERFIQDEGFNPDGFIGDSVIGGPDTINALTAIPLEHDVVFVTARTSHVQNESAAEQQTHEWLGRFGLKYEEIHFTSDKTSVDVDFFLDDKVENWQAYNEVPGTVSFLYAQPWNKDYEKTSRRVKSVQEYLDAVYAILEADPEPKHETSKDCWCEPEVIEVQARPNLFDDGEEIRKTSKSGAEKGVKQPQLAAVDAAALFELAKVAGKGAEKYDTYNYLQGMPWTWSLNAAFRHLLKFQGGVDHDEDDGLLHVAHAAWHCLALTSFVLRELGTDDRFKQDIKLQTGENE